MDILERLSNELNIAPDRLTATVALLDEGNTVPFVARYRKEVTGGLDDTILRTLCDRLTYLRNLEKRKDEVRALIDAQGKLDDAVNAAIAAAETVTEVDDIYRPFRPKRRTRASVARERGLTPLADLLMKQEKAYQPPISTKKIPSRRRRTLLPVRGTLSPKTSRTTRNTAGRSVRSPSVTGQSPRKSSKTPPRSTNSILNTANPSRRSRPTGFSPSTAARRRTRCPCPSPWNATLF